MSMDVNVLEHGIFETEQQVLLCCVHSDRMTGEKPDGL